MAAHMAKHERGRNISVCVLCMDDIPHRLRGHMSVVEAEQERGVVTAARSISFVCTQKQNGDIHLLRQHMPPSAYSSALSDTIFFNLTVNRQQYAPALLLQENVKTLSPDDTHTV